jgi:hypothetical protein
MSSEVEIKTAVDAVRELSGDIADVLSSGHPHDCMTYRGTLLHQLLEAAIVLQKAALARSACDGEGERYQCGDEMPPEIKSLIAQCEANVKSFDNDQMSEALHFAETLFHAGGEYAERWQTVLKHLSGCVVQSPVKTTIFGVTLPSPPVVPYRNTVAEFKAAIDAARKGVRG